MARPPKASLRAAAPEPVNSNPFADNLASNQTPDASSGDAPDGLYLLLSKFTPQSSIGMDISAFHTHTQTDTP